MLQIITNRLESFEKEINYVFLNKHLLIQAFTHRSYLNEHKGFPLEHNERLEFLGDAVLELVVTEYLYTLYPNKTEGELTSIRAALVNTISLSKVANKIGLDNYLLLSRGEAKDKGRARAVIWANAFEALIGALYLDGGYNTSKRFLDLNLLDKTEDIVKQSLWQDPKSVLQEKSQEFEGITPVYKTIKDVGPDHAKTFTVGVYFANKLVGKGSGQSKQEAETAAAKSALTARKWK
ncbi:MAG TPA: ribonuclease III [Candidatus Paceibacterota bacterium]